ncbi:MAG: PD-(D/E)XK nuclease family protein [Myxococcota bacterium]
MATAGATALPLLRDQARVVAMWDASWPRWAETWLRALIGERLLVETPTEPRAPCANFVVHQCHSPAAERFAVATKVLGQPEPSVVVVPADEVGSWAHHLDLLGVPVLAFVPGQRGATLVEKCLQAWADLHDGKSVARADLDDLILGKVLNWRHRDASSAEAKGSSADAVRTPDPLTREKLRKLWRGVRRGSGTLQQWQTRLSAVQRRSEAEIDELVGRGLLEPAESVERKAAVVAGSAEVAARLDILRIHHTKAEVIDLLRQCELVGMAAHRPLEAAAAKSALGQLRDAEQMEFADAWRAVASAGLANASGAWTDKTCPGSGVCWVVPWGGVPDTVPGRRFLCGLDRHPPGAGDEPWLSAATLCERGLPTAAMRAEPARREVERALSGAASAVLSYRTRTGQGATASPSAWLAQFIERIELPPKGDPAWQRTWSRSTVATWYQDTAIREASQTAEPGPGATEESADLLRRRQALQSHLSGTAGPWTGALGVRPPVGVRGHSVSGLQRFACNPYRYFLEKVLGLREDEENDDSLDSREQGSALHTALELPMLGRVKHGPFDLSQAPATLRDEILSGVELQYRTAAGDLLAEAVWTGDAERWAGELGLWLTQRAEELANAPTDDVDGGLAHDPKLKEALGTIALLDTFLADPSETTLALLKDQYSVSANSNLYKAMKALATDTEGDRSALTANLVTLSEKASKDAAKHEKRVRQRYLGRPYSHLIAVEQLLHAAPGQPLAVDVGEGMVLPMQGSIDRIEWSPERHQLAVVDYKSGTPDTKLADKIATGEHLQLPLYALALETLVARGLFGAGHVPIDALVGAIRLEFLKRKNKFHSMAVLDVHAPLPLATAERGADEAGAMPSSLAAPCPPASSAMEVARAFARQFAQAIDRGEFPLVQRAGKDWPDSMTLAMRSIPELCAGGQPQVGVTRSAGGVPLPGPAAAATPQA